MSQPEKRPLLYIYVQVCETIRNIIRPWSDSIVTYANIMTDIACMDKQSDQISHLLPFTEKTRRGDLSEPRHGSLLSIDKECDKSLNIPKGNQKSKKNRQYNGKMKTDRKTSNDLQTLHINLKILKMNQANNSRVNAIALK